MQYSFKPNTSKPAADVGARAQVPALTGLRFVAALAVAVAHGADLILRFDGSSFRPVYWMEQTAGLGMGLFFVLSGFVIHYNYRIAVTLGGLNGLGGFVWARFARLYPLYVFIVFLDILLGQKLYDFMVGTSDAFTDLLRALPYFLTFTQSWRYTVISNNTLIFQIGDNTALTWSISTEWFFYLSYPLVALLIGRAWRPSVTIVAALAWCAVWIALIVILYERSSEIDAWATNHYGPIAAMANQNQNSLFRWLMTFSPYLRIGEFILGCLMAQLYVLLQPTSPGLRERVLGRALLAVGVVSVPLVTYLMYAGQWPLIRMLNYNFGLAPSVAVIIFCAARYDSFLSRMMSSRPLVALGEASYSIYLIHFLVFNLSASFLGGPLPATLPNEIFLFSKLTFLLSLILVISLGLHEYFEAPTRRWLRSLWREKPGQTRIVAYCFLASPGIAALLVAVAIPSVAGGPSSSVVNGVNVISATYGANCGARMGNKTLMLRKACNGKDLCQYVVDVNVLGDPAPNCSKNFAIEYECAPNAKRVVTDLPAEAGLGTPLLLSCASRSTPVANVLSSKPAPTAKFAVERPGTKAIPAGEIHVRSATYGGNCGAPLGNATSDVQMSCDGERKCTYAVDVNRLGDPAASCGKAFKVEYECEPDGTVLQAEVPGEAGLGKSVELVCQTGAENADPSLATSTGRQTQSAPPWQGIRVLSATYGGNCGARIGNATGDVESACGKKASCDYRVDVNKFGDPAQHCEKSFFVKFQCGTESVSRTAAIPGESGLGSLIHLSCQ